MIIHQPWEGKQFRSGLNGQRVGIVGYSHWNGDPDRPDSEAFTQNVVNGVIRWDGHNFFTQIRNYFQFDNHHSFWQRVLFFNYARNCIGEQKDRYKSLRKEEQKLANIRFFDVLAKYRPQKVLVFSSKAWGSLPAFDRSLPFPGNEPNLKKVISTIRLEFTKQLVSLL